MASSPPGKDARALRRGAACLSCRKKKMKCDGDKPRCGQCARAYKTQECTYQETKKKSRTRMLREEINVLEERLRKIESDKSLRHLAAETPPFAPLPAPGPSRVASASGSSSVLPTIEDVLSQPFPSSSTVVSSGFTSTYDVPEHLPVRSTPPHCFSGDTSTNPQFHFQKDVVYSEDTMPLRTKHLLLDIFLSHRHQVGFHVNVRKFKSSLSGETCRQPHPALLNTIYLLGCHFSRSPPLTEMKQYFLARALHCISDALETSDRLFHVLQASSLLSVYFFIHCRFLEGYHHSSCAAGLALSLRLHKLQSSAVAFDQSPDDSDSKEYLAAYWQTYIMNHAWYAVTSLPPLSTDGIHFNEPHGRPTFLPPRGTYSVSEIFEAVIDPSYEETGMPLDDDPPLYDLLLRVRATSLFEQTVHVTSYPLHTPSIEERRRVVEIGLDVLLTELPPLRFGNPFRDAGSLVVHTLVYAAYINLYKGTPIPCNDRCLQAASSISLSVGALNEGDYEYLDPILSICWMLAAQIYIHLLPDAVQESSRAYSYWQSLQALTVAMKQLGIVFPLAHYYAITVEQLQLKFLL